MNSPRSTLGCTWVRLRPGARERLWPVLALWLGMFSAVLLIGCATKPERREPSTATIPAEVAAAFQRSIAGWNGGDLEAFTAIYADTATLALPDRILHGRPAILALYAPSFAPGVERDALAFDQFAVEVISPDAALVRAVYRNSRQGKVTRRGVSTLLVRRVIDRWQITHDHSS